MKDDTGTGWDQRWFAKPLVTGSIPARVSIHDKWADQPKYKSFWPRQWRFWLGRRFARWVLHAPEGYHSFRSGLLYDIEMTHALSEPMMDRLKGQRRALSSAAEAGKFKAEAIAARKELSKLKRSK